MQCRKTEIRCAVTYKIIGNSVAEWDDNNPLIFELKEPIETNSVGAFRIYKIDLTELRTGFEDDFLLNLKSNIIERRNRVKLITVDHEATELKILFQKIIELRIFNEKVCKIDEAFLLCIAAEQDILPRRGLELLSRYFSALPFSPIFSRELQRSDFPVPKVKKGAFGSQIDRILGKALTQTAVVKILDLCDTAFATGKLDIGHYSFAHLAFAVFCRPNSYRQIRVSDFIFDLTSNKYTIQIITSKTGEQNPSKTTFGINEPLGILLTKQRQNVIEKYGHLVAAEDIGKLALFPARKYNPDKSKWVHEFANQSWGMFKSSNQFSAAYGRAIKIALRDDSLTLSSNALRHTVGTLLAQTGASAKTIQSVLRHADDIACQAYVDIAFAGLIEGLTEALHPAFESYLPGLLDFRSKADVVAAEKRIYSEDLDTGQIEDTGECGRAIACENAPIVCYGCFRFRPCWDADHSINLAKAQREIENMEARGKPFEHMVKRARSAKNKILIIMNTADRIRDAKN
jgi:integrase